TAALLATIASLPDGAVVLPGLDTDLDDKSWTLIGDAKDGGAAGISHPQFAMQALLRQMKIDRASVQTLGAGATARDAFISEAFRPAEATQAWAARLRDKAFAEKRDSALKNLSLIEAANPEDEALAISVALREAVEKPGVGAALITPDRALARRVL